MKAARNNRISAPNHQPVAAATNLATEPRQSRPTIVVVGGGFGGLRTARDLKNAPVDVVVVDKSNHHVFQPLLYQVASAALSPADIAAAIRRIFRRQDNVRVVMGAVDAIDLDRHVVRTPVWTSSYDYLVLAAGATHSYFGHPDWETHAPGLKTIDEALDASSAPDRVRIGRTGRGPRGVEGAADVRRHRRRPHRGRARRRDSRDRVQLHSSRLSEGRHDNGAGHPDRGSGPAPLDDVGARLGVGNSRPRTDGRGRAGRHPGHGSG